MKVVIADDHPLLRIGVRTALAHATDLEVVAEAGDGDEALQAVREHHPDLLILDIGMPGLVCNELVLQASQIQPELKTLILTAHGEDAYVRKLIQVPISGYLLKEEAPDSLLHAVRVIQQGAVWFSQQVASKLMGFATSVAAVPDLESTLELSQRELQVLRLLSRGETNQVIATDLALAEQTVRNYVSTLYSKLGVTTRSMAIVWARARGIV